MKRGAFIVWGGLFAMSLFQAAAAAPVNEYNDRNFNDQVKRESYQTKNTPGAAYKYNDRNFDDRVKPQRFDNWASKAGQKTTGAASVPGLPTAADSGKAPIPENKKLTIKTHRTDPETLRKQANKPTPPKRELTYRPRDAYNPKEQLPPPPEVH